MIVRVTRHTQTSNGDYNYFIIRSLLSINQPISQFVDDHKADVYKGVSNASWTFRWQTSSLTRHLADKTIRWQCDKMTRSQQHRQEHSSGELSMNCLLSEIFCQQTGSLAKRPVTPPMSMRGQTFSLCAICLRMMSSVQRCDGSLLQTAGTELMQKLWGRYRLVLVVCSTGSPWSAERSLARAPTDATGWQTSRK